MSSTQLRMGTALALCLLATPAAFAQPAPTRDAVVVAPTAAIKGRVTAALTGEPLHRVRLTLRGPSGPLSAISDTVGQFAFPGLLLGSYTLTAARASYLTIEYGQIRPRQPGRTIDLRAGEVVDGLNMALYPVAMLSGRIVTSDGNAVAGALVEATEARMIAGARVPIPVESATTNDIGEFLISGLPPGNYSLRASTLETVEKKTTDAVSLASATTFYPGTPYVNSASVITLAVGQEVGALTIPLSAVPTARLAGRVESPSGGPLAGMTIGWSELMRDQNGRRIERRFGQRVESAKDGSFEIVGLVPGDYVLRTALSSVEQVSRVVTLSSTDLVDIVLVPRPDAMVVGTLVTDEGTPPPFGPGSVQIVPVPTSPVDAAASAPAALQSDWSFRFSDLDGPRLFRVRGLPDMWNLATVNVDGLDITDTPFEAPALEEAATRVQLVVTRKTSAILGRIIDAGKAPVIGATVIVFSSDSSNWGLASRSIRTASSGQDGHFDVRGLLPGRYFAAVRDFVLDGEWEDPAWLQGLRADGVEVEVREASTVELPLTLGERR